MSTTSHSGKYLNVNGATYSSVDERTVVDFGVVDNKGRAVGMSRHVRRATTTVEDRADDGHAYGALLGGGYRDEVFGGRAPADFNAGEVLEWFEVSGLSTRDGRGYGSAEVVVASVSLESAVAEFDKRVERARKAAVRKWAKVSA